MTTNQPAVQKSNHAKKLPLKFSLGFIILFFLALHYIPKAIIYLLLSFITAFLLDPFVTKLENKGVPRAFGAIFSLLLSTIIFVFVIIVLVPIIINQSAELKVKIPEAINTLSAALGPLSVKIFKYNVFLQFNDFLKNFLFSSKTESLISPVTNIVGNVLLFIINILGLFFVPLLSYWLLREFPNLHRERIIAFIPNKYHYISDLLRLRINRTFGGFLRGQILVSSTLALYYSSFLTLVGLDLSILLGILAGFLNIIPFIGIYSILTISLLIAFLQAGGSLVFYVLIIFIGGMILESSFLSPKFMSKETGLSPLTIIKAILVFGELFGILGIFVSVPSVAILKVIIELTFRGYKKIQ